MLVCLQIQHHRRATTKRNNTKMKYRRSLQTKNYELRFCVNIKTIGNIYVAYLRHLHQIWVTVLMCIICLFSNSFVNKVLFNISGFCGMFTFAYLKLRNCEQLHTIDIK